MWRQGCTHTHKSKKGVSVDINAKSTCIWCSSSSCCSTHTWRRVSSETPSGHRRSIIIIIITNIPECRHEQSRCSPSGEKGGPAADLARSAEPRSVPDEGDRRSCTGSRLSLRLMEPKYCQARRDYMRNTTLEGLAREQTKWVERGNERLGGRTSPLFFFHFYPLSLA